jgi:AcrR family transcriptional regulator
VATAPVDNPRTTALVKRIARADDIDAVALGLVDALLAGDDQTLSGALDALRDARARGGGAELDAAIAFAYWGLERLPSGGAMAQGTQAFEFLRALDGARQVGSPELRRVLEVDETQVSRTGRRLLENGLVTRRKSGRQVFWQLTPRGQRALAEAPAPPRSNGSEFWEDALGRGFDAAPAELDPTRRRIIDAALELHVAHGIRATTWPEIAERAGVPVETVEALFPTFDELTRSCGEHFMESVRLPPRDRAPEIFVRTDSEHERIHRLVETMFTAYERAGEGIAVGRRERGDVPAARESLEALDASLDALVVEAVRPLRPGSAEVAWIRGLTDLEVWRTLREQGATPEAAVEQASAAVERWLVARQRDPADFRAR